MAEFDEMKNAWQSQPAVSEELFQRIGDDVQASATLFQSRIFRRDMIELTAAMVVIPAFLFLSLIHI